MRKKLAENLKRVEQRIAVACAKAGRSPSSVKLVAVTKSADEVAVRTLVELGVRDLGESRVAELCERAAFLREGLERGSLGLSGVSPGDIQWHMIGHLQRNKVRALLPWVDVIQSVDSLRLGEEIDAEAGRIGKKIPILLEVNAGEAQKHGVAFAAALHLAEQLVTLRNLNLLGLMAMAPLTEDREVIRRVFGRVRELFDEMVEHRGFGPQFRHLSLGMSNDFELGIEAGATIVRIGSALFERIEFENRAEVPNAERSAGFGP